MTIKSDDTQVNLEQARKFGRVSDDGHVFVIVEGEEYAVGQLPGASEEEALAYFARKFENVEAQVSLLESRVENNSPGGRSAKRYHLHRCANWCAQYGGRLRKLAGAPVRIERTHY